MENFYVTKFVRREKIDPENPKKSLGIESFTLATIQGHVLGIRTSIDNHDGTVSHSIQTIVDNNITDRYERDYIGLNIEIDPGYDKFIQSANPEIQAQLMAANQGDLILVTGVPKNGGRNIRVLTFKVLKAAAPPTLSVAVDNTVSEKAAA